MRTGVVVFLLLGAAGGGCRPAERPLSDNEKRVIVGAVDSAMHAYLGAIAARDADRVVAHFADDPEFLVFFDAVPLNHQQMTNTVRGMFGGLRAVEMQPVTVQVTVLSPDAAIAAFSFRESFTDTAKKVTRLRGTASWTWRRAGSGWTIIHGDAVHLPDASRSAQ